MATLPAQKPPGDSRGSSRKLLRFPHGASCESPSLQLCLLAPSSMCCFSHAELSSSFQWHHLCPHAGQLLGCPLCFEGVSCIPVPRVPRPCRLHTACGALYLLAQVPSLQDVITDSTPSQQGQVSLPRVPTVPCSSIITL